jgi:hypothetical protein
VAELAAGSPVVDLRPLGAQCICLPHQCLFEPAEQSGSWTNVPMHGCERAIRAEPEEEDKAIGKTKQVAVKIIGDEKLHGEGKKQADEAKEEPNELNPFGDLSRLT